MIEEGFEWLPELFLRAPLYSFKEYGQGRLKDIIKTPLFQNALYLASPVFHGIMAEKRFDIDQLTAKELYGLLRYYNRMSFRPTPFGAFASFTLTSWSEATKLRLGTNDQATLHLLPGQELVAASLASLPLPRGQDLVALNPSLHRLGDTFRYVRSNPQGSGKLDFFIAGVEADALTQAIVALLGRTRRTYDEVKDHVVNLTGSTGEEATRYLEFLLLEQVLFHHGHGSVVGMNAQGRGLLPALGLRNGRQDHFSNWPALQTFPLEQVPDLAAEAARFIHLYPATKGLASRGCYYGALERPLEHGGLPHSDRAKLNGALDVLARLVPETPNHALTRFIRAFRDRFDQAAVPLLQALDPDSGIAYDDLNDRALDQGWLEGMEFRSLSNSEQDHQWTEAHRLFFRLWLSDGSRHPRDPIVLTENDLATLPQRPGIELPPSMAILFSKTQDRLIIDMAGGVTATSLIGRFTAFSQATRQLAEKIAQMEAALDPAIVYADIDQLSDHHIDNVNRRAKIYDRQIPVNAWSDDQEHSIALNDLTLSVREGRLILYSISLKERVIPRLSTAYNFVRTELGIFRLLCDLQFQGLKSGLSLDLEKLFPGMTAYPRVAYNGVILCPAKWVFDQRTIDMLIKKPHSIGRLHLFREKHGIPAMVTLGAGDQQLTFDLSDDQQALFFLACITGLYRFVLREYFLPDDTVKIGKLPHAGQFAAFLVKRTATYRDPVQESLLKPTRTERTFLPGSEWFYIKIYCTQRSADTILSEVIEPFLQDHQQEIRSWFFIRYQDPGTHLRIRYLVEPEKVGILLNDLESRLTNEQHHYRIRAYQTDSYQREIERYGADLINDVEEVFHRGSRYYCTQIKNGVMDGHHREYLALVTALDMAGHLLGDDQEIFAFVNERALAMRSEYRNEKELKRKFDDRYRERASEIKRLIGSERKALMPARALVAYRHFAESVLTLSGKLDQQDPRRRVSLCGDLIHMQLNRSFETMSRQNEAFTFHCLAKYLLFKMKTNDQEKAT